MKEYKMRRLRIDFEQEIIGFDEKAGTIEAILTLNPQRYEWKYENGKKYIFDKLDNIRISEELYLKFIKDLKGKPIFHETREINDADNHIKQRIPIVRDIISGKYTISSTEEESEQILDILPETEQNFVIMCVDIVDSTLISTTIEPKKFKQLISTSLNEIGEIVIGFKGYVLKYTGDGLIAFFPETSFNIKNDYAIDCALTIIKMVNEGLNIIFEEVSLPRINLRIGIDSGKAHVVTIGSSKTKQQKDIIGSVINLAYKMQAMGEPGRIYIGHNTLISLHTDWRNICEKVENTPDWNYKNKQGELYKVYTVRKSYYLT